MKKTDEPVSTRPLIEAQRSFSMQQYLNRGRQPGPIEHLESRLLLSNTTTELVETSITIGVPSLKDITFIYPDGGKPAETT
jgi:hypothetical protein